MASKRKTIDDKIDDLAIAVKHGFDEVKTQFQKADERFDKVDERFDKVDERFDKIENRLDSIEMKLNRVLYRQLDKHELWIKQIAEKVGIQLT